MARFNAFSWCRKQSINWWNYVLAFVVAFFIPVASVYIHSLFVLWRGMPVYRASNPLDSQESCCECLLFGAISFLVMIPFLRFWLLRWFVALALCAFWIWLGLLQVAAQK